MEYDPIKVGNRIREARILRDKTMKDLADHLKISEATISRYETGVVKAIKRPILESICKYLNVSMDYILGLPIELSFENTGNSAHIMTDEEREIEELKEKLHKNPELKILLSSSDKLNKEDIEKLIKIAQMFND